MSIRLFKKKVGKEAFERLIGIRIMDVFLKFIKTVGPTSFSMHKMLTVIKSNPMEITEHFDTLIAIQETYLFVVIQFSH